MLFAFIDEQKERFSVRTLCLVLEVSPSGYYARLKRPASKRSEEDVEITEEISEVFKTHRRRYGAPRIHRELRGRGRRVGRKRVARLMHSKGLRAAQPRRFVHTTDSRHPHPIAPNHLGRDFGATAPNQKWAGDITYIPTREGWLYLAVFLDLFCRAVIGLSMSEHPDSELTCSALRMALASRNPEGPLLVHSDRGSQYAAGAFRQLLADWNITPSMSGKGDCYDNAVSESFFATLKKELVNRTIFATREEARSAIFEYIVCYYNRMRMHSRLGYNTPEAFEAEWHATTSTSVEA